MLIGWICRRPSCGHAAICLCLSLILLWSAAAANLVQNPGIEAVDFAGKPQHWYATQKEGGEQILAVDHTTAHSGQYSLKIVSNDREADPKWQSPMSVSLTEDTTFDVSLAVKGEDVGWVRIYLYGCSETERQFQWTSLFDITDEKTFDWRELTTSVTIKRQVKKVTVVLAIQGSTGTAWFDDIRIASRTPPQLDPPAGTAEEVVAGSDIGDLGSLIRNSWMSKPGPGDRMPAGWKRHDPPQYEGIGRLEWVKGDPRPEAHALKLTWLDGSPYVAVTPSLTRKLSGERSYVLQGYCKTQGAGKAMFVVECVDASGTIIQRDMSEAISDSTDYATLTYYFASPPATDTIRVYCVNSGRGAVWFHLVTLIVDSKTSLGFPLAVSCEPADGRRFWNDDQPIIHSIANSPVSISFALWGDKSRLQHPSLVIDVPAALEIPEAFYCDFREPLAYRPVVFKKSKVERDGAPYVRYAIEDPMTTANLRAYPYYYNTIALCMTPGEYVPDKSYTFFYFLRNGNQRTRDRHAILKVLPPMAATPNPKRFETFSWRNLDIQFHHPQLLERVARKYEEAGMEGVLTIDCWPHEERFHAILAARNWNIHKKISHDYHWLWEVKAERQDGSKHDVIPCPSSAAHDPAFAEAMTTYLKKQLACVRPGSRILIDIEPGSVGRRLCFCDRCRQSFAARYDLQPESIRAADDILTNHALQWGAFWSHNIAAISRLHYQAIKAVDPGFRYMQYAYPIWFNDPAAVERKLFDSPLDTRILDDFVDAHILSFYLINGKTHFDLFDINARELKKPVYAIQYCTIGIGFETPAYNTDTLVSPREYRQQMIAVAASGGAGFVHYSGSFVDGTFFVSIDRAMREIAAVEDYYFDGTRVDEAVTVGGTGAVEAENVDRFIGVRAHRAGNDVLVTLFNFDNEPYAALKLTMDWLTDGVWTMRDPTRDGDAWHAAANDLTVTLASQDIAFLLFRRER